METRLIGGIGIPRTKEIASCSCLFFCPMIHSLKIRDHKIASFQAKHQRAKRQLCCCRLDHHILYYFYLFCSLYCLIIYCFFYSSYEPRSQKISKNKKSYEYYVRPIHSSLKSRCLFYLSLEHQQPYLLPPHPAQQRLLHRYAHDPQS